jgi:hypothetical protein
MRRIKSLIFIVTIVACMNNAGAQNVQTATNGLYHNPTTGTAVRVVGLGGTLTQVTTVDLGATFTFGFKKGATNYFTMLNNGNIGIGISPTSLFHLKAGTATAAPLKFTSGVNLTTAAAGAMEFDGTNLFFTPATVRKTIAFNDFTNIAAGSTLAAINGGTGQTTLAIGDLLYASAANTFSKRAIGTSGQVLTVVSGLPTWQTPAGGGAITSVFGRTGVVVAAANDYSFAQIGAKPTTLSGYGITDAATLTHTHALETLNNTTITTPVNGQVLTYNSATSKWVNQAVAGSGITNLNGLTGATQTFATGTSGTDFGISSAGTVHTFNIPTASAVNRGFLSPADWTIFNNKASGTGGSGYIQNQFVGAQSSNFWMSGTGRAQTLIASTFNSDNGNGYYGNFFVGDVTGWILNFMGGPTIAKFNNTGVGIGTNTPAAKLDVAGTFKLADGTQGADKVLTSDANGLASWQTAAGGGSSQWTTSGSNIYYNTGKIGIGTTNLNDANYKLFVEGAIRARKIRVDQLAWPDYVFEPHYNLPSLPEVEAFIKKNKHLPDVSSTKEIEKEGLDLGDNQAVLLRKIEELTLYIIELNKKSEEQNQKIAELEKKDKEIKELKQQFEDLKKAILKK